MIVLLQRMLEVPTEVQTLHLYVQLNADHVLFQYSFFLLLVFFVVLAAGISAYAYRRRLSEGFQVSAVLHTATVPGSPTPMAGTGVRHSDLT